MPTLDHSAAQERARNIKLLLFDVDGVLTDGTIWIVPVGGGGGDVGDPAVSYHDDSDGAAPKKARAMGEMKGFAAHDGIGVSLAKVAGLRIGFITKRVSEAVKTRARDLKLDYLYVGQQRKMDAVREIMQQSGLTLAEIAYAGDDIVDLPVMRVCGLAIAVRNARHEVLAAAHYITPHDGGYGAGRDAVEFILQARGVLEETVEKYLATSDSNTDIGTGNM